MTKAKIITIAALGAGLFAGSLAVAQTYNPYTYQFPTTQYYPQTQYQYPQYGGCSLPYSYLGLGARGPQVAELQRFLASQGYYQPITGYYGTITAQNVARYRQMCGGGYPYPNPTTSTFRLDRSFTLYEGQSAMEREGSLRVLLDGVGDNHWYSFDSDHDSVRVTLSFSCRPGTYCFYAPSQSFVLEEDESVDFMGHEVEVTDIRSDRATFVVRDEDGDDDNDDEDARIEVTDPTAGEDFEQGDEMRIAWSITDEPNNASVILDLYDEDDDRVGTIAILDSDDDDFEWDIPTGGGFCTQQFPNGLCGHDLEGDYYLRARLVSGNGFSGGFEYDRDDSGVFTIED